MKKKLLLGIVLIAICVLAVGCEKKKEEEPEPLMGGWEVDITEKQANIQKEALEAFERAAKKEDKKYRAVALLGKQIVAGTNYLMLAVEDEKTYKIITVYNDLQNESEFIYNNTFDFTKYTNKEISYNDPVKIVGNWTTDIPSEGVTLDQEIQAAYENAIEKINDTTYLPIAVVGHQLVAGTNYAIVCYGRVHNEENSSGVYVLTLYKDLQGAQEITSSAYIDFTEYTK